MNKIKTFMRRLGSMSLKRMFRNIKIVKKTYKKSSIVIFFDMLWCIARYGVGYLDYLVFGFAGIKGQKKRRTFMTMNDNLLLARKLNKPEDYDIFKFKITFNKYFSEYLGRGWLDLRETDFVGLESFCRGKDSVFCKACETFGGQGIDKLEICPDTDFRLLYDRLSGNKQWLIEDTIVQHPEMNKLCSKSVNTLRVVTLVVDGKAHFVYSLLRMGSGEKSVDNISSGGMYTKVGDDGVLHLPAFCDKTGEYYDRHPKTGTVFEGFKVPYFRESVEMCLKAATVVPSMRYIGWDVAITPDGPCLVEGNHLPSYDMCQNRMFNEDGVGMKPKFESIIGNIF